MLQECDGISLRTKLGEQHKNSSSRGNFPHPPFHFVQQFGSSIAAAAAAEIAAAYAAETAKVRCLYIQTQHNACRSGGTTTGLQEGTIDQATTSSCPAPATYKIARSAWHPHLAGTRTPKKDVSVLHRYA